MRARFIAFETFMAFELSQEEHVEDELRKIVRQQLQNTVRALNTSRGSRFRIAVHESRKSVKKVRAAVELLKRACAKLPRKDRKRLKWAAEALSRLRDSTAIIETFDRLRRRYPRQLPERRYGALRRGLVAARAQQEASARRDRVVGEATKALEKTRKSAKQWTCPSLALSRVVPIVATAYGRSRNAMKRARATGQSATLHGWRKELKTLWYQLRLTKPLTIGVAPLVAELKRLETELGDDHNLVVLGATLRGCDELRSRRADVRHIDRLAGRMRRRLRRRAFALGRRLHRRKPAAFARWIRASTERAGSQKTAA